jgi:hypothetical protein
MDVFRLGLPGSSSYLPEKVITGYDAMIWTERFQVPGQFELTTYDIAPTLAALPEQTLISVRGSREVMVVETRSIEVDDDGNKVLKVTGRSLGFIFDKRHIEAVYGKKRQMRKSYTAAAAAAVLMWNAVDNPSLKDVTRGDKNADTAQLNDYPWNGQDVIPNVAITDSVTDYGSTRRWWLNEGPLGPQLANILIWGDLGLRCIRPKSGPGSVVSVATALATRGDVTRTVTNSVTQLRFDVYQGLDRSHTQSSRPIVGFKYIQDHIENAEYLFSSRDLSTICEVMSSVSIGDVARNATEKAYAGLARRVMSFDAGDPEIPPEPEKPEELRKNATKKERADRADAMDAWLDKHATWKNKRDNIVANFKADAETDALRELKKARRVSLFQGDISPLAPYVFGTHYNLGDAVSLYGEYGEVERMIVSEYVRTEDSEGDRGYPGLSTP